MAAIVRNDTFSVFVCGVVLLLASCGGQTGSDPPGVAAAGTGGSLGGNAGANTGGSKPTATGGAGVGGSVSANAGGSGPTATGGAVVGGSVGANTGGNVPITLGTGGRSTIDSEPVAGTGGTGTTGGTANCCTGGTNAVGTTATGGTVALTTVSSNGFTCLAPNSPRYVQGANSQGYGFAFITLSDTDINDNLQCGFGNSDALCTIGSLAYDNNCWTYNDCYSVATVGYNLNEADQDSTVNPVAGTIQSLTLIFSTTGLYDLRVQVNQGSNFFCAQLPWDSNNAGTNTITIDASDFNTRCWDNDGTAWDGTGATGIQLVVPVPESQSVAFNVCLVSVVLNLR